MNNLLNVISTLSSNQCKINKIGKSVLNLIYFNNNLEIFVSTWWMFRPGIDYIVQLWFASIVRAYNVNNLFYVQTRRNNWIGYGKARQITPFRGTRAETRPAHFSKVPDELTFRKDVFCEWCVRRSLF